MEKKKQPSSKLQFWHLLSYDFLTAQLKDRGFTQKDIYDALQMPKRTFERKLKDCSFSFWEMVQIASILGIESISISQLDVELKQKKLF